MPKTRLLRRVSVNDARAVARLANDPVISRNLGTIPYPYRLRDAQKWIEKNRRENRKNNPAFVNFLITIDGAVAGAIGLFDIAPGHKAEIGYWLGREYRGKGIMAGAVKEITDYGFKKLKLKRIYAGIFRFNRASMEVLKKAGYSCEGICRQAGRSEGRIVDTYLFAKTRK